MRTWMACAFRRFASLIFCCSSLPDLIRQSMSEERPDRSIGQSFETAVSMDRRVKPGA